MSEKTCNGCTSRTPDSVPYYVYEAEGARAERHIRRLWIALVVSIIVGIVAAIGVHIGWLWYESQFETMSYQQEGNGLNNVNSGEQGDVSYEPNCKD